MYEIFKHLRNFKHFFKDYESCDMENWTNEMKPRPLWRSRRTLTYEIEDCGFESRHKTNI